MPQETLPIILSIPHGGFGVPGELGDKLALTETDIYNECDLWIAEIFDFAAAGLCPAPDVLARVSTLIARSIVDVNRQPDDLDNLDGPVKAQTSYGRTTCTGPLSRSEKEALVEKYWHPYHAALQAAIARFGPQARLFLDCHNMAQTGPTTYGDPGKPRPLICLANMGGADGYPLLPGDASSCSPDVIQRAAAIAGEVFADVSLLEPQPGPPPPTVSINLPYNGGYILHQYARQREERGLPPGMMIEFNRGLYVGNQDASSPVAPPNQERIALLRKLTHAWLSRVVELG